MSHLPLCERGQVRTMLAGTLKGIVGQRLIRSKDGGRAACEVMATPGCVQNFTMDPAQTGGIQQAIASGEYYGMRTFVQALLRLSCGSSGRAAWTMRSPRRPRAARKISC